MDKLADGGVANLSLLGGEPLILGDQLFAILARARQRQMKVSIVTNGLLLDSETSRRLTEHGLSRLVVSIEGPTDEVHDRIRGRGTFERLVRNLETFVARQTSEVSPGLTVNTVLCRPNRDTFAQMIPFCRDLGADEWNALTLNYIGYATDDLDSLALSQEEHTGVALEIGRLLRSTQYSDAPPKVNLTIIYPLVWEYLCKKYDVRLPQPEICCSASISLVYISPAGDFHLCDRVDSTGYTGSRLETETIRPMSLLTSSVEDIWKSKQYVEMFNFVNRAETYAGYDPCNHCKYLSDRTCNPCPLQSYRRRKIRFKECLKAKGYLGDISRYDEGPRTFWERQHQFERVAAPAFSEEAYERIRNGYPNPVRGTRHAIQADGVPLLMHPDSLELAKLNEVGEGIWRSMTGLRTTDDVVASAVELYVEVSKAFDMRPVNEGVADFTMEVKRFILLLQHRGFVEFGESRRGGR